MRCLLLPLLVLGSAAAAQPPVYHWPLDESTGTIAHAWGGSPGQLVGGTTWAPTGGHHQGAARFDGVDDRIVLGPCDLTSGGGALSISLWAKADFVTGMERTLIAKATGPQLADHVWSIAFVNGTALRFRLKAGSSSTELTTPPASLFGGTWYHIVATYDGAQLRLFVNASLMGAAPKAGAIGLHPQAPASLGALSTGAAPFSGWIDDARIYDRALTEAEVLDLLFATMTTGLRAEQGAAATGFPSQGALQVLDPMGRLLHMDPGGPGAWERMRERCSGLVIIRAAQDGETRAWRVVLP